MTAAWPILPIFWNLIPKNITATCQFSKIFPTAQYVYILGIAELAEMITRNSFTILFPGCVMCMHCTAQQECSSIESPDKDREKNIYFPIV